MRVPRCRHGGGTARTSCWTGSGVTVASSVFSRRAILVTGRVAASPSIRDDGDEAAVAMLASRSLQPTIRHPLLLSDTAEASMAVPAKLSAAFVTSLTAPVLISAPGVTTGDIFLASFLAMVTVAS